MESGGKEEDAKLALDKFGIVKSLIGEKVIDAGKDFHSGLEKLLGQTKTRVSSMECKEDTMNKVMAARAYGWGDFESCINLTRKLADVQLVLYDFVLYTEDFYKLVHNITKECQLFKSPSSLIEDVICVIKTVSNHPDDFSAKTDAILYILTRLENITKEIQKEFQECMGNAQTNASMFVEDVIANNCENQRSLVGSLLHALKPKSNKTPTIIDLSKAPKEEKNKKLKNKDLQNFVYSHK